MGILRKVIMRIVNLFDMEFDRSYIEEIKKDLSRPYMTDNSDVQWTMNVRPEDYSALSYEELSLQCRKERKAYQLLIDESNRILLMAEKLSRLDSAHKNQDEIEEALICAEKARYKGMTFKLESDKKAYVLLNHRRKNNDV